MRSFHSAITLPASVMFLVLLVGYLWCLQQNTWGIGGGGTFLHPSQFMRIQNKPEGYGSIGAFQGDLNPLSSKSIIDTCVMPILLFGSENWILSDTLLCKLEAFLGELSKRALKWPMHFSNTSAVLALDMQTMRSRILCRKLSFLRRLLDERATGVGAAAMRSLTDDIESLCIVKECSELETSYGTI